MGLFYRADYSRLHQFNGPAVILGGMDLRTHLGGDLVLALDILILHPARFLHGVGKGFLGVDMLVGPHRCD